MLCCTPSSFEWLHSCGRHPSGPAPAVGAGGVARIQRYQLATPSIYAPSRAPRSVLHLSTGTKKQRPGRVAGGSNLVVKALLASKQLGHYLRAGKKATTCEQASRLLLHSQLGVNQVATHAVLGCNACGTWPRCNPELPPVQPVEHLQALNHQGGRELRETDGAHVRSTRAPASKEPVLYGRRSVSATHTSCPLLRQHSASCRVACWGARRVKSQYARLPNTRRAKSLRAAKSIHACIAVKWKAF